MDIYRPVIRRPYIIIRIYGNNRVVYVFFNTAATCVQKEVPFLYIYKDLRSFGNAHPKKRPRFWKNKSEHSIETLQDNHKTSNTSFHLFCVIKKSSRIADTQKIWQVFISIYIHSDMVSVSIISWEVICVVTQTKA